MTRPGIESRSLGSKGAHCNREANGLIKDCTHIQLKDYSRKISLNIDLTLKVTAYPNQMFIAYDGYLVYDGSLHHVFCIVTLLVGVFFRLRSQQLQSGELDNDMLRLWNLFGSTRDQNVTQGELNVGIPGGKHAPQGTNAKIASVPAAFSLMYSFYTIQ